MVVPAAMPPPIAEADIPEEPPTEDIPVPPKVVQQRQKPNPLATVGIFAGWLKDVVTPKKKEPKPMIELPPRPPSIPKPEISSEDIANVADGLADTSETEKPEVTAENVKTSSTPSDKDTSSLKVTSANLEPANVASVDSAPETAPTTLSATPQQDDDEDSNWPEDKFWD